MTMICQWLSRNVNLPPVGGYRIRRDLAGSRSPPEADGGSERPSGGERPTVTLEVRHEAKKLFPHRFFLSADRRPASTNGR
jgi:hypothetical protein